MDTSNHEVAVDNSTAAAADTYAVVVSVDVYDDASPYYLYDGDYYNDTANVAQVSSSAANILGIWVTGAICLLGGAGNILSFIVLWRAFSNSAMFLVLRAIAVSDAVFLFSVFVIQTVVNLYTYVDLEVFTWCNVHRGYVQFYVWPVLMITQMTTVWLTVLVSIERYIAICHPLKAAALCTKTKVRRCVIAIYVGSVLFNVPRYLEYSVTPDGGNIEKTYIGNHVIYRFLYTGALYGLMLFLVPLCILLFLNFKLVRALREGKRQWKSLQFRQKKEQSLTFIPLTIVLIFFVCGTLSLVVNIIDSLNPAIWHFSAFVTFMVVSNFLVVLNSASNFVIYCLLGQKFRDKLKELCQCRYRQSSYRAVHHLVTPRPSEV